MPGTLKASIDVAVERYVAESRYTLQERPGVIWRNIRTETLPQNEGPSVNIPKYGTVNVTALTEGVDMSQAQEITDTGVVITPAEFGGQVWLSDMLLMTTKDEFFRVAGRVLGDGFDRQREQTLCDDAANFSVTSGAAAQALNLGHVMADHASIKYNAPADGTAGRGGEPGPDPIYAFITPAMAHSLKKTMVGGVGAAGTTQVNPELDRAGYSEEFEAGGVMIRTTVNLNKDTSDDALCPVLSKEAWIGVMLGGGPSAEKERDASLRAWEVNFVGRWARAEYNDAWGRGRTNDSALPTS